MISMRFLYRETGPNEVTVSVFEGERHVGLLALTREGWIKFGTVLSRSNALVQNWHADIVSREQKVRTQA